ncbi:response regulator transcription factor [Deinococcus radiopugnans]|uniref:FixJ family two-component response regulator n=2 Tax=Deinococcus radiopugnans TaxID=57497 RepID=A0ABR6NXZ7_9DEIO|nr:response regulator [Deinococcus radiopugnans]MBB6018728.1 FixJ family two-component response regulator [Deinococcus radiopugnans ATCC 19172]
MIDLSPGDALPLEPTVYLVDDDDAVRGALGFLLGTVGLNVRPFADGLALERALDAGGPPAIGCLLLDIRMPHISGLQLQVRLQERGVDLPVILLTGHADVELCRRAFRQGAADFLSKPVDGTELLEAVQRAVRQHVRGRQRQAASGQARERLSRLTVREHEVLRGMLNGQTSKQIARALAISARTVETHRASLFTKLEADSLAEVIRIALAGEAAV